MENLGFEYRALEPELYQKNINKLMILLRRTPFWTKGHLRLGWLCLEIKEVELAFSSFEAVRRLKPHKKIEQNAILGLVRCFLARGDHQKALGLLNDLPENLRRQPYVKEQLAVCLMASERFDDARKIIQEIPEIKRSAEVAAVLAYLINK